MRKTLLNFRSPNQRSAEFRVTELTNDSRNLNFSQPVIQIKSKLSQHEK